MRLGGLPRSDADDEGLAHGGARATPRGGNVVDDDLVLRLSSLVERDWLKLSDTGKDVARSRYASLRAILP